MVMIGSKMPSKIDFLINKDKEDQETGSCTEEIDKQECQIIPFFFFLVERVIRNCDCF